MGRDFTTCRETSFLSRRKMWLKFKLKQTCRLPAKQKTRQPPSNTRPVRQEQCCCWCHTYFSVCIWSREGCCTVAMREHLPSPSILSPSLVQNLDFIMGSSGNHHWQSGGIYKTMFQKETVGSHEARRRESPSDHEKQETCSMEGVLWFHKYSMHLFWLKELN